MRRINLISVLGLCLAALLLAGCGTFQVGIEAASTDVRPTDTQTPLDSRGGTALATPSPTLLPSPTPERINFSAGATVHSLTLDLTAGQPRMYVLKISANQKMTVAADTNATIAVLDSQKRPLPGDSRAGGWSGTVPETADYILVLSGQGRTSITITIPPPPG